MSTPKNAKSRRKQLYTPLETVMLPAGYRVPDPTEPLLSKVSRVAEFENKI